MTASCVHVLSEIFSSKMYILMFYDHKMLTNHFLAKII